MEIEIKNGLNMKWRGREQSTNVERKGSAGFGGGSGPRGRLPLFIPRSGLGVIILIGILIFNSGILNNVLPGNNISKEPSYTQGETSSQNKDLEDFLSVVLKDTEDVWTQLFHERGERYQPTTLFLYNGTAQSACGIARSNVGPFYCSGDTGVYIDVSFYYELKDKFHAPGDFALAYVLAHEVGHHVQNQLGIMNQVFEMKSQLSEKEFNKFMVRMELQADYFAGVFAHYIQDQGYLEEGDFKEAMDAAAGVGDDRIQSEALGRVIPDKFTHGTSEQRMRWFERGFEYGDLEHGNTFSADNL